MGVLLIKCPQTGKAVPTGIEVDPKSFANLPDVLSYLKCPECGLDHAWWTREAWLEKRGEIGRPTKKQHNDFDLGGPADSAARARISFQLSLMPTNPPGPHSASTHRKAQLEATLKELGFCD
jgi:hypothetical protein